MSQLRITEIFHSLQGEARSVGVPTVFVRLTGCPLRCQYCDTEYAFSGGELLTLDSILAQIRAFGCEYVCVTGGEPLARGVQRQLTDHEGKGHEAWCRLAVKGMVRFSRALC